MPQAQRTDRYLDLAKAARSWQLVAMFLSAATVVLAGSFAKLALSTRLVPYVVEVDRGGNARWGGPIEAVKLPEERLVIAELRRFLWNLRVVVNDSVAQAELIARAYAFADTPLRTKLDQHFATPENDPRQIATRASRTIAALTILPLPGTKDTFELEWREVELDRTRVQSLRERSFKGLLTVSPARIESPEALIENPLGLLITDFHWTEVHNPTH